MMQDAYVLVHVSGLKFLETQSLTTHSRCYLHMAYPLRNRLALQGLQEKTVVAGPIHTYLTTSAYPAAQRMAAVHTRL